MQSLYLSLFDECKKEYERALEAMSKKQKHML